MARSFVTNIKSVCKIAIYQTEVLPIFLLVFDSTGFAMMGRNHSITDDFMEYRVSSRLTCDSTGSVPLCTHVIVIISRARRGPWGWMAVSKQCQTF